jgi:hypothetical protein
MKGGGNGFVMVLLSLSWWMMRERDESGGSRESSLALEEVMWVLQQMLQALRSRCNQGEEGGGDNREEEDPNTRPKKRCVSRRV